MKTTKRTSFFLFFLFACLFFFPSAVYANATDINGQKEELTQKVRFLTDKLSSLQKTAALLRIQNRIDGEAYAIVNLSSGAVIMSKNTDQAYSIASITKLMSSLIAFENADLLNRQITLTREMLRFHGQSPSLFLGARVSGKDLVKASLIQSSNDAAEAKAHSFGRTRFIALMNEKAAEIGMLNTQFYDASGLSYKNRSTPNDIVRLIGYIHQNHPEILSITKETDFSLPDRRGRLLEFKNLNHFYKTDEFVGGKSGFIPEAKRTFASLFEFNGRPVAIVVFYSQNARTDISLVLNQIKRNGLAAKN